MCLSSIIDDLNENPRRQRSFYEYPELYEFYHSRVLDRDAQVELLKRFQPENTRRVLEYGCGTGPLLVRIEGEYEEVLGVDIDERMLASAREKITEAEVFKADFTEWSAADEGRVFDMAVLMGGLLHLTEDRRIESFAGNVNESLREGGAFMTFFYPLSDDVDNGSKDVQTVESDRYSVEAHSITALTSSEGHYTTTYLFIIHDKTREKEARMGTVFQGRSHDPDNLRDIFLTAEFSEVELIDREGPTILHAVK